MAKNATPRIISNKILKLEEQLNELLENTRLKRIELTKDLNSLRKELESLQDKECTCEILEKIETGKLRCKNTKCSKIYFVNEVK